MKNYLLTLFLGLSIVSYCQPIIDSSSMPRSGDSLWYSIGVLDSTVLSTYLLSDTNLIWDYDSLISIGQRSESYLKSSETPYSGTVKNRIGLKLADTISLASFTLLDVYDYYQSYSAEFVSDYRATTVPTGLSFPLPTKFSFVEEYKDKDEIYQFPLQYGDRDSSTFNFEFRNSFPAAYYSTKGYRINEVDAWGELRTPYGTFDCIRLVTDVFAHDSLNYDVNNIGFNSHTREYKWLCKELRYPALIISGSIVNDTFFLPTNIEYQDTNRNVPSLLTPRALFFADETNPEVWDTVNIRNISLSLLPLRFEWKIEPNSFLYLNGTNSSSESITVQFTDTGFYDIQLIATNSEGRDTLLLENYIDVDSSATGIHERLLLQANQVKAFPNPSSRQENIIVRAPKTIEISNVQIIGADGKEISSTIQLTEGQLTISAPNHSGIYFIRIHTKVGIISKKILVQ